ncbi:hypothetical protein G9X64_12475 [Rhizobium sophorae]|uniref:Uncharacterized protein n=2 Tax=Rhizobium TaxID=379 RepID=A0A246DR22_9HYPH|nr:MULTISPECIES: hypothetical protein [Rhizobium]MBB4388419.1 hypothetical protein [Rhizobium leguminosarum]NNU37285.1 hypothetical protein [Rhizobium sophorae]OWO92792.1 hypothetical protein B5E41_20285 [Rhizobium esperanzae]PCK84919.1 hypothetical protein CPT32_21595 [Rhizobium sophoriradicis]PDS74974.1 hypothetical protein CO667_29425 [Rhizobium sp. L43]
MASPWKFLARLISPGRQQKRESGSNEKVTSVALPISGPTEAPAEESVNGADRPVSEELPRHGQAAAISVEPVHSDEAKNGARDRVERGAAKIGQAANQALSGGTGIDVTAAHDDTTQIRRTVKVAPRKQRRRSKEAVAVANVSPVSQIAHIAEEIRLDEEIRVLRGQLARKLTLQNAQLRKMLERFER